MRDSKYDVSNVWSDAGGGVCGTMNESLKRRTFNPRVSKPVSGIGRELQIAAMMELNHRADMCRAEKTQDDVGQRRLIGHMDIQHLEVLDLGIVRLSQSMRTQGRCRISTDETQRAWRNISTSHLPWRPMNFQKMTETTWNPSHGLEP